jgi:hypothetical protein
MYFPFKEQTEGLAIQQRWTILVLANTKYNKCLLLTYPSSKIIIYHDSR